MIVDVHQHLGIDDIYDRVITEDELIREADAAGVDTMIVQPACTQFIEKARGMHDRIAELARAVPGRVYGMACVNPHYGRDIYFEEIKRCVKELNFVGIKLHTLVHACLPNSKDGRLVFETAAELNVPVMVHTGKGLPFSKPLNLLQPAKDFPHTPIIVAHAGALFLFQEALILAKECPNIYLETAVPHHNSRSIRKFVKGLDAQRIMMGSGSPYEMQHMIWKIRDDPQTRLSKQEQEWCLGRTAVDVFGLSKQS
jgi:predicted TIM-barrel fold metal-dependent hydrolase